MVGDGKQVEEGMPEYWERADRPTQIIAFENSKRHPPLIICKRRAIL